VDLNPTDGDTMPELRKAVDLLVYASAVLGLLFVYVASSAVPTWLLYSLALGEVAYALAALAVWRGYRLAYYAVMALAVLVLLVSLPQPEHYAFASNGEFGRFLIFAAGSVLQVCLLVSIPLYLRRKTSS
jgi:hypothetical protein